MMKDRGYGTWKMEDRRSNRLPYVLPFVVLVIIGFRTTNAY